MANQLSTNSYGKRKTWETNTITEYGKQHGSQDDYHN